MNEYCYWCGTRANGKFCERCRHDADPPADVYFLDEECGDCSAKLPRWAHYCPKCGRRFGVYDPSDPRNQKKHNRGQAGGLAFWSAIALIAAALIPVRVGMAAFKYTMPAAAVLLAILWVIFLSRREQGAFVDGTVTQLYTEQRIHRERSAHETTITGRPVYHEVPVTVYCTAIRWDNGKEQVIRRDCIAADHIQLRLGDRLRFFKAKQKYQKL